MTSVAHDLPRAEARWRSRPVLADLLRGGLLAVPLVASVVVVYVVGSLIPMDAQRSWWALTLVLVAAVLTAVVSERASQRLLPLTVLLQLTMIFPDRAPSRLRLARAAVAGPPTELIWSGAGARTTADTVLALMTALGAHDRKTRGHSERVRVLCDVLAEELRLDQGARDRLRWAALLHDVGKMAVAPDVLNKPAALDSQEFDAVKEHPVMGASISAPLLPWLGEWGRGILEHHERYDGSGYPSGLAGHEISQAGRIVALVDAFETMTAARAYKKPMATRAAREELARCAGTQFDPVYVRAFLNVSLPRMMWALGPLSFLVHAPFLRSLAEAGARSSAATGQAAASAAGVAVIATAGVGSLATATAESPPAPPTAAPPAAAPTLVPSDVQASRAPQAPSAAGTRSSPTDLGARPGTTSTPVPPGSVRPPDSSAVGSADISGSADSSDTSGGSSSGSSSSGSSSSGSSSSGSSSSGGSGSTGSTSGDRKPAPGQGPVTKDDTSRATPRSPGAPRPPDETRAPRAPQAPGAAAPRGPREDTAPKARPAPRPPQDRPDPTPKGKPAPEPTTGPATPRLPDPPALPPLPVELPTLPPLSPAERAVRFEQAPESVTSASTAVFQLATAPGLDLQCRDTTQGGGLGGPDAGWAPCGRSVTFTGLGPGHYTFQTRSVDGAGRTGAVATHGWRVVDHLSGKSLGESGAGPAGDVARAITGEGGRQLPGEAARELPGQAADAARPLFSRGRLPF